MKTVNNLVKLEKNSLSSPEDDIVMFSKPLAITDDSRQWNMTKYDISSLDIDTYDGTVTADHGQNLSDVIGKVINLRKEGNKVLIDGIRYAIKENPLAVLAKNLLKGGFATGFSIETIGDEADDTLTWKNHKLAGLSQICHPNNRNAYAVIANSLQEAKKLGLNTNGLELLEKEKSIYFSDKEDYNLSVETNGGPGSGNHAPGQGRGVGKPGSSGSSKLSSLKEKYERAEAFYENIDSNQQQKDSDEEKEYLKSKSEYRKALFDSVQEKRKEIDELQQEFENLYWEAERFDKAGEEYGSAGNGEEAVLAYEEAERIRTVDMKKVSDEAEKIESEYSSLKKELSLLDESPSQRFERKRKEAEERRVKALTPEQRKAEEEAKKAVEKRYKEIQKKVDEITKKFGNSISSQIQDNSNRLTKILNAQSKGNPYHDKLGKFTSGPNSAFNIDSLSQYADDTSPYGLAKNFKNSEAAEYVEQGIDGMMRLGIETSERTYDSSYQAAKERVDKYLKNRTDKFAQQLKKNDTSDILVIGEYMSDLASMMNKQYKKYASSISIKDSKKREFEVNQRKNQINKLISRIERHSQLQSKWKAAETYKLINDSSLGILQTLKYLD